MPQHWLLYPLAAMAFLVLFIGLRMLMLRIRAVRKQGLSPAYFKLNKGAKPPDDLMRITQHFDNLFEMPVLFYLIAVLIFITAKADYLYLILAWGYFATRIVHAYIHTTYNNVLHRKNIFLISTVVLYWMWGRFVLQLLIAGQ